MGETFGGRLRERREQQQISLSTIAEQTKIKLSLLEALERGDVSHWPSGIFRRAFIRAYADAIGLEPDVVVREFLELYPDPAEIVEPVTAIAAMAEGSAGGPPTRLRYLVASAVGSLARRRTRTAAEQSPVISEATPSAYSRPTAGASSPAPRASVYPPTAAVSPPRPAVSAPTAIEVQEESPTSRVEAPAPQPAPQPATEPSPEPVDLPAIAELCTMLARIGSTAELSPLLQETARVLDASGLVVWIWDPHPAELHPALAHGYSERVLAQLPGLPRDANNATAAAFREAQMCVVPGNDTTNGALVLPLLTPSGCVGVLALELQKRNEEREAVRAAGAIIAAQLAALIGAATTVETAEGVRSAG